MAITTYKGINIRSTTDRLMFRSFLQDSAGAKVTTGTTSLRLYEIQDTGSFKSYDFNDNTFKTTALTTETASMTHQTGNNGTTDTGIWTYALTTLTGFTINAMYLATVSNTGASPPDQTRDFQFGGVEGDVNAPVSGRMDSLTSAITAQVTVATNNDKTDYTLSSSGLDSISTTQPAGVATTFREMVVQTWRRFFKKITKDTATLDIKTYADNNSTVLTTQAISSIGDTDTVGPAS